MQRVSMRLASDSVVDVGNRLFSGLDAVEKVALVARAFDQMDFVRADLRTQQRLRLGVDVTAADVDPPLCALKYDPLLVLLVVGIDHRHAVGILDTDVPTDGTIGEPVFRKRSGSLHLDRPAVLPAVSPLGDVDVMDTPVSADAAQAVVGDVIPDAVALFLSPWAAAMIRVPDP